MAAKNDIDLQAQVPAKRKRRSKAEIEEARRQEDAQKIANSAAVMREEMTTGKTLRAKVASTVLAAILEHWDKIEGQAGQMSAVLIKVEQSPQDGNMVSVKMSFQQTIIAEKSLLIDDGIRELPL